MKQALKTDTYDMLDKSVFTALRAALEKANEVPNFDLEDFVKEIADKNKIEIDKITRIHVLEAIADIALAQQDSDAPASDAQRAALRRFRVNPDHFKTKAEASEMMDVLIQRVNARSNARRNASS